MIIQSSALWGKGVAPSDRINLGLIGCGGLGKANLNACITQPNVVVTAACDVWKERLDPIVARFRETCTGWESISTELTALCKQTATII
jgi:predicted dehydrogenase